MKTIEQMSKQELEDWNKKQLDLSVGYIFKYFQDYERNGILFWISKDKYPKFVIEMRTLGFKLEVDKEEKLFNVLFVRAHMVR